MTRLATVVVASLLVLALPGGATRQQPARKLFVRAPPSMGCLKARTGPSVSNQARPWTRWWWLGSALDAATITRELEALKRRGLRRRRAHADLRRARPRNRSSSRTCRTAGCKLLEHTLREARRLGLGVDMATGTGWPFGGPWVSEADAARALSRIRLWRGSPAGRAAWQEPVQLAAGAAGARDRPHAFRSLISSIRSKPIPTSRPWRSNRCDIRKSCRSRR